MRRGGFSLIEAIIGTALMLVVFVSIFGVFNMGIKLVGKSKAKAGATALAQEQMEMIRNLPYDGVATLGGIPAGNIPQTETIILNGIEYTRRTLIRYVDDPKDGIGALDENGLTADYKVIKSELSWQGASEPIIFVSNIIPKGIETVAGGGTLVIDVFDASVQPVVSAKVYVENASTSPAVSVDYYTNSEGRVMVPGAPAASSYEITVSKENYSTAKTYDAASPNVNPSPGHLTIIEGETTEASFVIDRVSAETVRTLEPIKGFVWQDFFDDWSKISSSSNIAISGGQAMLAEESTSTYYVSGYLISSDFGGYENLVNWSEFSWNDSRLASTSVSYQIMHYQDSNLVLVPDSDLPGNAAGFESSSLDLSGLNIANYPVLKLRANLITEDFGATPSVLDWQLTWNAGPITLPNIAFNMKGQKTIGAGADGSPIYKYSQNLFTNSGGQLEINNLEFDAYNIIVDGIATGWDVSESCPFQPNNILPNINSAVDLYLVSHSNNTLLIGVRDAAGAMINEAGARLYRIGYDENQTTSSCGQSFFTPLSAGTYSLSVSKAGFENFTGTVDVTDQIKLEVIMNPL